MVESGHKRILVAVDGSEQAFEALRYVSRALPADRLEIVLFYVMTKIPETFWDLGKVGAFRNRTGHIKAWEIQQETFVRQFMSWVREMLMKAGIPQDAVSINIHERDVDIAKDIIAESLNGYDAVVVGRKGQSELKDLVIGSVANKLVEKLVHIPVWVVGGAPEPGKVLIGMDTSDGAMWAVDHVANMLGGSGSKVMLFHALRSFTVLTRVQGTSFVQNEDREWIAHAEEEIGASGSAMNTVFEQAKERLVQAGLAPDRIECKIVKGVNSRAGAIVAEAEREGYGTIVLGRRGLSRLQEFFAGRVSNKVLQLSGTKAIWVVS